MATLITSGFDGTSAATAARASAGVPTSRVIRRCTYQRIHQGTIARMAATGCPPGVVKMGPAAKIVGPSSSPAATAARRVILIATGSEVAVALATADALETQGIGADVVSMPCMELFERQDAAYKADLLPDADPSQILRVSIEAGVTWGW